ncbi:MAG: thiopeptide-type bacteriocin biosynthesis protein, partial [Verrucomicrobiota bacterium]
KYGGPLGLDIAEELFDASTSAVLALLPALGDRRPSRLGIALSMTLSALASFGLSWAEMTRFLERYRALWERYRPAAAAPPSDRLRAAAAPFVGHARAILRGERPKGGALARWADAVVNAATRLEAARGQVLPLVTMAGPASTDVDRLLFLLANYVHTHNNRLGLQPSEEAYLAQVATAALEGA